MDEFVLKGRQPARKRIRRARGYGNPVIDGTFACRDGRQGLDWPAAIVKLDRRMSARVFTEGAVELLNIRQTRR